DYFHYSIVEHADWRAVDDILALKNITAQNTPEEKFRQTRTGYAQGMGGLPIVGDPDHVASQLIDLSKAGLTGVAVSLVNYLDELPFFCAEVLPRLQRVGLREKRGSRLRRPQSSLRVPLSLSTLDQRSVSLRMKAANSAGELLLTASMPTLCSLATRAASE